MRILPLTTALVLACTALTSLSPAALAKQGGAGWQTPSGVNVTAGSPGGLFQMTCPAGFSVINGAFFTTSATNGNGFSLVSNGPRIDITPPNFTTWGWSFVWPNGGAPSGSLIVFDVNCKKGAP
jgi:hypothetical protein